MNAREIYSEFWDMGLVGNQSEFSKEWLGRSPAYFRMMNWKNLDWSAGVRGNLWANIRRYQQTIGWATSSEAREQVTRLNKIAESLSRELVTGGF